MTGFVDPTREAMTAFRDLPADQPIAMINLLRFRDTAAYPLDHPDHAEARTGAQAYAAYGRAAAAPFARSGGVQVWLGRPDLTLIGPADEAWDLAFIVQYETAERFIVMVRDPEYQRAVVHRQAAVADSRLIRCQPRVAGTGFGEG